MQLASVLEAQATSTWKLQIKLLSDLCISTGQWHAIMSRACVVDSRGQPFIPGSHIKGVVRSNVERLAQSGGLATCRSSGELTICDAATGKICEVCLLFGPANGFSPLVFSDFVIKDQTITLPSAAEDEAPIKTNVVPAVRTTTDVNYGTRKSRTGRLIEIVPAGTIFSGQVDFRRPVTAKQETLLRISFHLIRQLGSGKSSGLGSISMTLGE